MTYLPKHLIQIINMGFVTAWLGILLGLLFSFIIPSNRFKIKGIMMGFVSGLMLSIITIDVIPESIKHGNQYFSAIGVISGLFIVIVVESIISPRTSIQRLDKGRTYFQAALLMAAAMSFDNFPGGIALGSIYTISSSKALEMSTVFIIHGIPEGLSIGLLLSESNANAIIVALFTIIISIPMAVGSLIGGIMSEISPVVVCLCLSFAGGLMLYITFREIIPKTMEFWSGRLSSIGSVIGIVAGILTMLSFH